MEYFVYFEIQSCAAAAKDPLSGGKTFQEYATLKRERGEFQHSPRCSSRFAYERDSICAIHPYLLIRRTEPCGPLHGGGPEPYGRWK